MDYKHRVPGNKKRKRTIEWIPPRWQWPVAGVGAILAILGLWLALGGDGEKSGDVGDKTPDRFSQNLDVPPMGPPQPPVDKSKSKDKELAKTEVAKSGNEAAGRGAKDDRSKRETEDVEPSVVRQSPPIRFTFYKILPEKEVIIPESDIRDLKRDERLGNVNKPEQYQIQVGSYNVLPEAEKVKARLAQLKVKSKVESMKIEGIEWHRVKIGPFDKVSEADRVRDYLKQNQISSVVQKSTSK